MPQDISKISTLFLKSLLCLAACCAVATGGWVLFTTLAKDARESMTPQQISSAGRWIQTEGASVHVQEWGDPSAPVVLLVHGTGAWSGTWFGLTRALTDAGWRVAAIDLPPFGLSQATAPEPNYTRAEQARRILEVAKSYRQPVALAGHSFGAGPALEAAMISSSEHGPISKLALIDAALGLGPRGEPPSCEPRAPGGLLSHRSLREAAVAASATWPGLTSRILKGFVHRKESVGEDILPAYREPFAKVGYSAALGDWAWAFSDSACEGAQSLRPDALQAWHARSQMPVDLIWGEQDEITPPAQALALLSWMPHAKIHLILGVGHIPHIEDPKAAASVFKTALGDPKSISPHANGSSATER